MKHVIFSLLFPLLLIHCGGDEGADRQTSGLRKISGLSESQIDGLRQAGADIIVREPDYVVIRTSSMTAPLAFSSNPIEEKDLVQRLVHIHIPDSVALQTVLNSGVDFWNVEGDTVVARAFDIYINDLKAAGLSLRVVAQNASQWVEEQ
jgi:hypothetical protein